MDFILIFCEIFINIVWNWLFLSVIQITFRLILYVYSSIGAFTHYVYSKRMVLFDISLYIQLIMWLNSHLIENTQQSGNSPNKKQVNRKIWEALLHIFSSRVSKSSWNSLPFKCVKQNFYNQFTSASVCPHFFPETRNLVGLYCQTLF